jgi:hypothetical protein
MMPHDRRFQTVPVSEGVTAGVRFHGKEKELATVEVYCDEKFGGMPTQTKIRLRKTGRENGILDKNGHFSLIASTRLGLGSHRSFIFLAFHPVVKL